MSNYANMMIRKTELGTYRRHVALVSYLLRFNETYDMLLMVHASQSNYIATRLEGSILVHGDITLDDTKSQ